MAVWGDSCHSEIMQFWIPASAGMTVIRRSPYARTRGGRLLRQRDSSTPLRSARNDMWVAAGASRTSSVGENGVGHGVHPHPFDKLRACEFIRRTPDFGLTLALETDSNWRFKGISSQALRAGSNLPPFSQSMHPSRGKGFIGAEGAIFIVMTFGKGDGSPHSRGQEGEWGLGDPGGGGAVAFFDFDADGEVVLQLFQMGDDDDALEVLLQGG